MEWLYYLVRQELYNIWICYQQVIPINGVNKYIT
jgi:hypothetical protein